jgi:hypothetical protein
MQEMETTTRGVVKGSGGRYVLDESIGRGGAGEVFKAQDTQLQRWVAIKRIHNAVGGNAEEKLKEARHLAALQHPNIVTVYDFLEDQGDVLVVMELLRGRTLDHIAGNAPLLGGDFVELMRQTLEGLTAAHALGMLHRDIKPGNIMVLDLPSGAFQVKILDFGLSKIAAEPSTQTVDEEGFVTGSVYYMAPEQMEGLEMDVRSDLYSLGCVAYFALCSRNPFVGASVADVINAHLDHTFAPLHSLRPDLPESLCAWVERMLARDPADRPSSAAKALEELQAAFYQNKAPVATATAPVPLPAPPAKSQMPLFIGAGVAALILVVGGIFLLGQKKEVPVPAPVAAASPTPRAADAPAPTAAVATGRLDPKDSDAVLAQVGKKVEVEGRIERDGVSKTGAIRFLNFAGTKRGDLTLVFFVKANPEGYSKEALSAYIGKNVRVRGQVSLFEGSPQIVINSFSQIEEL